MKGMMDKSIKKRSGFIVFLFILLWTALCGRLFYLQVIKYDEYQQAVIDNVQRTNTVSADRGVIYDRNNIALATNVSVWRVFISPVDIVDAEQAQFICKNLSELLEVDYDTIYLRSQKVGRADETVKKNVEKDEADRVRAFINEYSLSKQIHLEATTKRYYPYDTLAANVIGFVGTDGGSYGIEKYYDTDLQGTPGRYVVAKNGLGMDMPFKYESYIEAEDGHNIVTTIDMRIQQLLEKQLKLTYEDSVSAGGAIGIVMDVNTGGILAMAQYPTYNLNQPSKLTQPLLDKLEAMELTVDTDDYNSAYNNLLFSSWNNKAVSWTYEPGSTFKVVTASMALEENLISQDETFYCPGYIMVPGYPSPIHCHKAGGHGRVSFRVGLQQSCNPTLATVGQRIGAELFYKYFTEYGYTSTTGIDIGGEAKGIYGSESSLGLVELSVYSFGQTFKTTPIQQITAIASVANGGKLVTPHILSRITDSDGNTVRSFETDVKRQIISSNTASYLTGILEEGVSGDGGAKNAFVLGYKVAAKTGTSQKRDILDENGESYLYVGSTVAYAPADDPQVAALIIVDEPMGGTIYGSMVAAPYISDLLEEVLPYLGVERTNGEREQARSHVQVWDYTNFTVESALMNARNQGLKYEFIGSGDKVVSQVPKGGSSVFMSTGKILFYLGDAVPDKYVTVPDVMGNNATTANNKLVNAGFNIKIEGALNYDVGAEAKVVEQSPLPGESVLYGSVVKITLKHTDGTD